MVGYRWSNIDSYEATGQMNWLKKFIPGLKVVDDIYRPLKLYYDYNLAVQYAQVVLPNTLT